MVKVVISSKRKGLTILYEIKLCSSHVQRNKMRYSDYVLAFFL